MRCTYYAPHDLIIVCFDDKCEACLIIVGDGDGIFQPFSRSDRGYCCYCDTSYCVSRFFKNFWPLCPKNQSFYTLIRPTIAS